MLIESCENSAISTSGGNGYPKIYAANTSSDYAKLVSDITSEIENGHNSLTIIGNGGSSSYVLQYVPYIEVTSIENYTFNKNVIRIHFNIPGGVNTPDVPVWGYLSGSSWTTTGGNDYLEFQCFSSSRRQYGFRIIVW